MAAVVRESRAHMRGMRPEDLIVVMQNELAAYEFSWTTGIFRDCIRSGYECWVLVQGDQIIGHGVLSIGAGEAHLLNVCVAPSAQRRGHGKHLLRRLTDIARWQGAQRIFLEVRPSNVGAVAMYHHAGFNEIGTRPSYYPGRRGREDALVLALELLPQTQ